MSEFTAFIFSPLLWIAFTIFAIGVAAKFVLYFLVAARESRTSSGMDVHLFVNKVLWLLLPISPGFVKKPFSTSFRYFFHVCAILGPLFLAAHIALLETSRLGWHWPTFPDPVSRILTWVVMLGAIIFLLRRVVVSQVRKESKAGNFVFIVIVLLPFLTGYLLSDAANTFDPEKYWQAPGSLGLIHATSSAALLVAVAFLYMQVKYRRALCTTCGACSLRCPMGAIKMSQDESTRSLSYRAKVCVHCETCVMVCPESAAHMEHVITTAPFFNWGFEEMQRVQLAVCAVCKQGFRPLPQVEKVRQLVTPGEAAICLTCKRRSHVQKMRLSRS